VRTNDGHLDCDKILQNIRLDESIVDKAAEERSMMHAFYSKNRHILIMVIGAGITLFRVNLFRRKKRSYFLLKPC